MLFWLLTLGAGAFFRFYHIQTESLWLDEGYSVEAAVRPLSGFFADLLKDLHPPVYTVLLHFWMQLFGTSETAVRSLSAVFGLLTLPVIYALAKRLFDTLTARCAVLILSLSLYHVYYAQEARSYTLMAFLAAVSFYCFLRLIDGQDTEKKAAGIVYVVSSVLMLYTHSFGLLTLAAQNLLYITALLSRRAALRPAVWFGLQTAVALAWAPWLVVSMGQAAHIKGGWIPRPTPALVLSALREYAGGFKLFIFYAAAAAWGVRESFKKGEARSVLTLAVWAGVIFLAPLAASFIWTPVFYPRYMIAATFAASILAARGLAGVPFKARTVLIALFVLLSLNSLHQNDRRVDKEQWREATAYVDRNFEPGDLVIIQSRGTPVFAYYRDKSRPVDVKVFPSAADKTAMILEGWNSIYVTEKNIGELDVMTSGRKRVWLVQSHAYDEKNLADERMVRLYGAPVVREKFEGIVLSLYA